MSVYGYGSSDIGQARENNQDAILVDNDNGVFVVADGMGGHSAGEVASRLAVDAFAAFASKHRASFDAAERSDDVDELRRLVGEAVVEACAAVFHHAATDGGDMKGMGTTLTALVALDDTAVVAHVGDSRAYLLRDGRAHQLTADHTFAADLARRGIIGDADVKGHPYANVLTRVLGPQPAVVGDVLVSPLVPGDRYLLSSDGLTEYVPDLAWLAERAASERPDQLVDDLVSHANQSGGRDNISVICVDVAERDSQAASEVCAQLERLSNVPLFDGLRLADATRILNQCQCQAFAAGESVFEPGDPRHGLIVVLDGQFRLHGDEDEPRELGAKAYIGASTLLSPRRARRRLSCVADGRLLFLWREAFVELCSRRPWLGVELYARLGARLAGDLDGALADDRQHDSPEWF